MALRKRIRMDYRNPLGYLKNKPKRVNWEIVVEAPGKTLTHFERYDMIFDDYDLKIRGLL